MFFRRFRYRSSVAIVALVSVVILLIIAMGLIEVVLFASINTERNSDIIRGRWFLEGRVEEFFDGIITGDKPFALGKFVFKEPIEGAEQAYTIEIAAVSGGDYVLNATMRWKDKYPIEQRIVFSRLNPFDYVLFFNNDDYQTIKDKLIIDGNIAARGGLSFNKDANAQILFFANNSSRPRIDYWNSVPNLDADFFTNASSKLILKPYADMNLTPYDLSVSAIMNKNLALKDLSLPSFMTLFETFLKFKDDRWIINNYGVYSTVTIANYLDSEKQLIGFGDGYSTSFNLTASKVMYVYVKKISDNRRLQRIESMDYAYYYGIQNRDEFYTLNGSTLRLTASAYPVSILLDEESYRTFGAFYFKGLTWSYLSSDERVEDIYFDKTEPESRLVYGIDYTYDKLLKAAKITASAFYKDYTWTIGVGDGSSTGFRFTNPGGRIYIYVGNQRTTAFTTYGDSINFDYPVPANVPVRVVKDPPTLYIRKAPPAYGTGIFVDKSEKVAVLDLSSIQNYPEHGVIIATVPVLIKGAPREPVAIIGWNNIYIDSINPTDGGRTMGAPVFIASRTGVWIYRAASVFLNEMNRCVIYSPLDGLYTIFETGEIGNPPVTLYGSLFLTGENPTPAMNMNFFAKNFIYWQDIKKYLDKEPFSIFPLPVNIKVVRRS